MLIETKQLSLEMTTSAF